MRKMNSYFKSCFLLCLAACFSFSLSAKGLDDGLVLHYTFDNDEGGIVQDVTGISSAAILQGTAAISADGQSGKALHLPTVATPAVDYLQVPEGVVQSLTDFTIAVWLKLDNVNQWARVFDFGTGQETNMFLTPRGGAGNVRFVIKKDNTTGEQIVDGKAPLPIGRWVHVAVTGDFFSNTVKLYVDGELVGEKSDFTSTPASLGYTTMNYIGKAQYPDPGLNGYVDDFRIYNRAFTHLEVLSFMGVSADVANAYANFVPESILGTNLSFQEIDSDLTLPTTAGNGVAMTWESSNPTLVGIDGKVTQQSAPMADTLTVTFSKESSTSLKKQIVLVVLPSEPLPALITKWLFSPANITMNNGEIVVRSDDDEYAGEARYNGVLKNQAQIRTIGNPGNQFHVLDMGVNNGYMDMGTEIGESIYKLTNYAVGGYFYIATDAPGVSNAGNFLYSFSNTMDAANDRTGYLFTRPYSLDHSISTKRWEDSKGIGAGNAYYANNGTTLQGVWHHIMYVQEGTKGTIYLDGVAAKTGEVALLPLNIALPDRTGTLYNWLGRPCYGSDSYLRGTLVYDFRLYSVPVSGDDMQGLLNVNTTLSDLNTAYAENPNAEDTDLASATNALTLGDLSNVTSNITLPAIVPGYPMVSLTWSSSDPNVISKDGKVTLPLFDADIILTATLMKSGKIATKEFTATVKTNIAPIQGDLLVHYDFSQVQNDTIVIDQAEKHFKGTLKNEVTIETLQAEGGDVKVLRLGNGKGYFDLGHEIGQLMYKARNYTLSAYFCVDTSYADITKAGNFLWTFANGEGGSGPYLISILNSQRVEIRGTDNHSLNAYTPQQAAPKGVWRHFAFTQQDDKLGRIYIDGMMVSEQIFNYLPADNFFVAGHAGTLDNWIGRSNYSADVYLRNTRVADFRMYGKALTEEDFNGGVINVPATLAKLESAISNSVKSGKINPYNVYSDADRKLVIEGLTGREAVSIYDIMGRKQSRDLVLTPGIYVVKIDNYVTKIFVK